MQLTRGSGRSERWSKSLTWFEDVYSRMIKILSYGDEFCKDQGHEHRDRREVRWLFLEIQAVLFLNYNCIWWHLSDTHFQLGHLALMMCYSLPQIPCVYCCPLGLLDHVLFMHRAARVPANNPWFVPTSQLGCLTLMMCHSAWRPVELLARQ